MTGKRKQTDGTIYTAAAENEQRKKCRSPQVNMPFGALGAQLVVLRVIHYCSNTTLVAIRQCNKAWRAVAEEEWKVRKKAAADLWSTMILEQLRLNKKVEWEVKAYSDRLPCSVKPCSALWTATKKLYCTVFMPAQTPFEVAYYAKKDSEAPQTIYLCLCARMRDFSLPESAHRLYSASEEEIIKKLENLLTEWTREYDREEPTLDYINETGVCCSPVYWEDDDPYLKDYYRRMQDKDTVHSILNMTIADSSLTAKVLPQLYAAMTQSFGEETLFAGSTLSVRHDCNGDEPAYGHDNGWLDTLLPESNRQLECYEVRSFLQSQYYYGYWLQTLLTRTYTFAIGCKGAYWKQRSRYVEWISLKGRDFYRHHLLRDAEPMDEERLQAMAHSLHIKVPSECIPRCPTREQFDAQCRGFDCVDEEDYLAYTRWYGREVTFTAPTGSIRCRCIWITTQPDPYESLWVFAPLDGWFLGAKESTLPCYPLEELIFVREECAEGALE